MFDIIEFQQDFLSDQPITAKCCKTYAGEIEENLLEYSSFSPEIFSVYMHFLSSEKCRQRRGIYHFFKQLYYDFDKLSARQKYQLQQFIQPCLTQHDPMDSDLRIELEHNLEHWLTQIMKNKYPESNPCDNQ